MTIFHLLLLAIIQGITEFLPVSSSAHLALFPQLTGLQDQGQFIDVAVHVGTLGAVMIYFRADVAKALSGIPALFRMDLADEGAKLAYLLVIATIPVVVFGFLINLTGANDMLRSVKVIGWAMLVFGILLYILDQSGGDRRTIEDWNPRHAWVLGFWQAVALIPGSSRSGMTITGARALGYNRTEAARIAMLMSIPTIIASGVLLGSEVAYAGDTQALYLGLIAALFAFGSALVALFLMMRLLRSISFTPYVIYRVLLGATLLYIAYS